MQPWIIYLESTLILILSHLESTSTRFFYISFVASRFPEALCQSERFGSCKPLQNVSGEQAKDVDLLGESIGHATCGGGECTCALAHLFCVQFKTSTFL